jgi:hypothetical protein
MECRAALGHNGINRQDAAGERRQDVTVHPAPKDLALLAVAPFDEKNPYL